VSGFEPFPRAAQKDVQGFKGGKLAACFGRARFIEFCRDLVMPLSEKPIHLGIRHVLIENGRYRSQLFPMCRFRAHGRDNSIPARSVHEASTYPFKDRVGAGLIVRVANMTRPGEEDRLTVVGGLDDIGRLVKWEVVAGASRLTLWALADGATNCRGKPHVSSQTP